MTARFSATALAVLLSATALFAAPKPPPVDGWKWVAQTNGVTVYTRPRAGTSIREFKAVGEIEAPPRTVRNVLDDVENYPRFMPRVKESRLLKREGDSALVYQRVAPLFCSERDYTLRIRLTAEGNGFACRWDLANGAGPAPVPGVVRMKANEGSWILEAAGERKTRVTYCIYNDTGGAIPAFILNRGNQAIIGKLFEAVRKQTGDAKYNH